MEKGEKYINEKHCVICQEQDNVSLRECKDGTPFFFINNQNFKQSPRKSLIW